MGRVVTESELVELVRADRAAGRTLAFANGCFDVLHVGHARYLAGARAQADRLVVAINSDASERALKGESRPIMPEDARAELVAALRADSRDGIGHPADAVGGWQRGGRGAPRQRAQPGHRGRQQQQDQDRDRFTHDAAR